LGGMNNRYTASLSPSPMTQNFYNIKHKKNQHIKFLLFCFRKTTTAIHF